MLALARRRAGTLSMLEGTSTATRADADGLGARLAEAFGKYHGDGYAPKPDAWAGEQGGGLRVFTPVTGDGVVQLPDRRDPVRVRLRHVSCEDASIVLGDRTPDGGRARDDGRDHQRHADHDAGNADHADGERHAAGSRPAPGSSSHGGISARAENGRCSTQSRMSTSATGTASA